ncbi:MAG: DUF2892 domain-containing protein [Melioribacteraceae bacterium]|nr:DUF2892 domain-containing protein [Melioribacteraceae bacterium]
MKKNVGSADRIIRFIIGLAIIVWGIIAQSWWGLIGIVPILTASINWCPLYLPFGISTCKTKEQK